MNRNTLKIGIVSEDPNLLREATWGLTNFGYEVICANDFEPFQNSLERSPVDLLLVDADHTDLARICELPALGKYGFTYKILLYHADRPTDNLSGLESAFNDAITKPLNGGEMLARIRAGARFVEFEHRHREQSMFDRPTGLMSQRGILKTVDAMRKSLDDKELQSFSMVVLELDYLDSYTESHGAQSRDRLLREIAKLIAKTAGEDEFSARLQNNTLALVIPDSSFEEGEAVATSLHDHLQQSVFDIDGMQIRQTATMCVAAWNPLTRQFRDILTAVERTLSHANVLGGASIVPCGQFDQDYSQWQDKNWAGIDLSSLTARDAMVPFTFQWDASVSSETAEMAIRNSGVAYIPCLGDDGLYLGVISRETPGSQAPEGAGREESKESSILDRLETPQTVREDLPYAELMDHFTADDQHLLVVLRNERPLGYVTHAALASLLESVDQETFRNGKPVTSGTDYLLVPDYVEETNCAEAVHAYSRPETAVK